MAGPDGAGQSSSTLDEVDLERGPSAADLERLAALRGGDLSIPAHTAITIEGRQKDGAMGQLYAYRGIVPRVLISRIRHEGCGGRAGRAELLTGIESASSRPVRKIVLMGER